MRLLLLAAAFSLLGCTTTATVAPGAMTAVIDKLEKNDRISVRTASGWDERLRVVDVDAASIRTERRPSPSAQVKAGPSGIASEPMVFARADILEIQVTRAAPGKTAALAAGIYFGSLIMLCGDPTENNGC
jgi:hypothetical protein